MVGFRVEVRAPNEADPYFFKRVIVTGSDGMVYGCKERLKCNTSMTSFPTPNVTCMSLRLGCKVNSRALEGKGAKGQRATKEHVGEGPIRG